MITSPILLPAVDVGKRITKEYAKDLQDRFRSDYPNLPTEVIIPNEAILAAVNVALDVSGVNFVFGMKNSEDPNSIFLALIPCTSADEGSTRYYPLRRSAHPNHLGELLSEQELAACLENFRDYQMSANTSVTPATAHRSNFFGRKVLEELTTGEGKVSTRFSFGRMEVGYWQLIMEPLDVNNFSIWEEIFDYGKPDPPG